MFFFKLNENKISTKALDKMYKVKTKRKDSGNKETLILPAMARISLI